MLAMSTLLVWSGSNKCTTKELTRQGLICRGREATIEHMFEQGTGEPDRPVGRVRMRLSRAWERPGFLLTFVLLLFSDLSGSPVNLDEPPPPHHFPEVLATVSASGTTLAERAGPSTYHPITGHLADASTVSVLCQTYGQALKGTVGTS